MHEGSLDILTPVRQGISLDDLDLEDLVVGDERRKSCQTLASRTTHSEQEGIAEGLPQNSLDTSDVIAGIQEHDQVHLCLN